MALMKKNSICTLLLLGFVAIGGSFFIDRSVTLWIAEHSWTLANPWMVFLTDFGLFFGVLLFGVALWEKHLWKPLVLISASFLASLEATHLLKMIFRVPRPFETWAFSPLDSASGFSFPSMHAAFIFSSLPFFFEKGRLHRYRWAWALFAGLVALSRVRVGVHYLSDVVSGALLGYAIGAVLVHLEHRFRLAERFLILLKDHFEVRRQVGHAFIGLSIIGLYAFDLLTAEWLLWILVAGGLLSLISQWINLPFIKTILDHFERPHVRRRFPGRGSFFMVLGCLLAMVLFEKSIALAAMAIMALGDSTTNVLGRFFGRIRLPYNPKKTLDGALMGVIAATLGAFYFVPFGVALGASITAMFIETLDLKIGVELDDNILVPLVAGGVMLML